MLTIYGTRLCPDCEEALDTLDQRGISYDYVDIFASTQNLKALLAYRDHHPAFDPARAEGFIGIPCFVTEDGRVTLALEDVLEGRF